MDRYYISLCKLISSEDNAWEEAQARQIKLQLGDVRATKKWEKESRLKK